MESEKEFTLNNRTEISQDVPPKLHPGLESPRRPTGRKEPEKRLKSITSIEVEQEIEKKIETSTAQLVKRANRLRKGIVFLLLCLVFCLAMGLGVKFVEILENPRLVKQYVEVFAWLIASLSGLFAGLRYVTKHGLGEEKEIPIVREEKKIKRYKQKLRRQIELYINNMLALLFVVTVIAALSFGGMIEKVTETPLTLREYFEAIILAITAILGLVVKYFYIKLHSEDKQVMRFKNTIFGQG